MSANLLKVLAGAGFAAIAVGLSLRFHVGRGREIALAAVRAIVQLAAVGGASSRSSSRSRARGRLRRRHGADGRADRRQPHARVAGARGRALVAIAVPALAATGALLAIGAFDFTARAAVPTAGILIGGAMVATTLTGRRLLESLRDDVAEIETRLVFGDTARDALAPAVQRAVHTALVPIVDQTRSVGLVTLPGTFVGLILGGASPAEAAATQSSSCSRSSPSSSARGLLLAELQPSARSSSPASASAGCGAAGNTSGAFPAHLQAVLRCSRPDSRSVGARCRDRHSFSLWWPSPRSRSRRCWPGR